MKKGSQKPTQSRILPFKKSHGKKAIDLYNKTGRKAQKWQVDLTRQILATNNEGLYVHTKAGYSIPRRNGKNEIIAIRELYALIYGEKCLHTAHRTTTSSSAAKRLSELLDSLGYIEIQRPKKGETYEKGYIFAKQFGLERIQLLTENSGKVDFRTRTSKGGLGEGFDILIIDEAQEYTEDQESSLKYVVSDSKNPQTIMCGTPPTMVSSGTVFPKFRKDTLEGKSIDSLWAEWSVEEETDPFNKDAWYKTNPSLGLILTERKIMSEIGSDILDFNIQRLGYWSEKNLKSAIAEAEWKKLYCDTVPEAKNKNLYIGIKYGNDGVNTAMSIAFKTIDNKVFLESIDIRATREGNEWIIDFIKKCKNLNKLCIDGQNGQQILTDELKANKIIKKPILPTVAEIITANAAFEQAVLKEKICHKGQESLKEIVSNCEHRNIGSKGGFGYKSIKVDADITLMDSAILAYWLCSTAKEVKQQARY